jgi:hypothetical protein
MEYKTTYIHETHTLYADNGELYMLYDDDKQLTFNIDTLYKDLPSIIRLCVEEKNKMDKFFLDDLKNTVAKL